MIRQIISNIKLSSSHKINEEVNKFSAADTIQKLLNQIDFNYEVVPAHDSDKLQKLFTTLKGEGLNISEIAIIEEISKKTNEQPQQII